MFLADQLLQSFSTRPKCFAFGTAVVQRRSASCPPRRPVKDLSGKRAPRPDLLQISGVLNYYILIIIFRYSVFKVQSSNPASRNSCASSLRDLSGWFASAIRDREQFHAPDLSSLMRFDSRSTCRSCPRRARAKHFYLCARLRL